MSGHAHGERYLDLLAVCLGIYAAIVDRFVVIGGGLYRTAAITTQLAERLPRHLHSCCPRAAPLSVRGMGMQVGCAVLLLSYRLIEKRLLCSRVRFSSIKAAFVK